MQKQVWHQFSQSLLPEYRRDILYVQKQRGWYVYHYIWHVFWVITLSLLTHTLIYQEHLFLNITLLKTEILGLAFGLISRLEDAYKDNAMRPGMFLTSRKIHKTVWDVYRRQIKNIDTNFRGQRFSQQPVKCSNWSQWSHKESSFRKTWEWPWTSTTDVAVLPALQPLTYAHIGSVLTATNRQL